MSRAVIDRTLKRYLAKHGDENLTVVMPLFDPMEDLGQLILAGEFDLPEDMEVSPTHMKLFFKSKSILRRKVSTLPALPPARVVSMVQPDHIDPIQHHNNLKVSVRYEEDLSDQEQCKRSKKEVSAEYLECIRKYLTHQGKIDNPKDYELYLRYLRDNHYRKSIIKAYTNTSGAMLTLDPQSDIGRLILLGRVVKYPTLTIPAEHKSLYFRTMNNHKMRRENMLKLAQRALSIEDLVPQHLRSDLNFPSCVQCLKEGKFPELSPATASALDSRRDRTENVKSDEVELIAKTPLLASAAAALDDLSSVLPQAAPSPPSPTSPAALCTTSMEQSSRNTEPPLPPLLTSTTSRGRSRTRSPARASSPRRGRRQSPSLSDEVMVKYRQLVREFDALQEEQYDPELYTLLGKYIPDGSVYTLIPKDGWFDPTTDLGKLVMGGRSEILRKLRVPPEHQELVSTKTEEHCARKKKMLALAEKARQLEYDIPVPERSKINLVGVISRLRKQQYPFWSPHMVEKSFRVPEKKDAGSVREQRRRPLLPSPCEDRDRPSHPAPSSYSASRRSPRSRSHSRSRSRSRSYSRQWSHRRRDRSSSSPPSRSYYQRSYSPSRRRAENPPASPREREKGDSRSSPPRKRGPYVGTRNSTREIDSKAARRSRSNSRQRRHSRSRSPVRQSRDQEDVRRDAGQSTQTKGSSLQQSERAIPVSRFGPRMDGSCSSAVKDESIQPVNPEGRPKDNGCDLLTLLLASPSPLDSASLPPSSDVALVKPQTTPLSFTRPTSAAADLRAENTQCVATSESAGLPQGGCDRELDVLFELHLQKQRRVKEEHEVFSDRSQSSGKEVRRLETSGYPYWSEPGDTKKRPFASEEGEQALREPVSKRRETEADIGSDLLNVPVTDSPVKRLQRPAAAATAVSSRGSKPRPSFSPIAPFQPPPQLSKRTTVSTVEIAKLQEKSPTILSSDEVLVAPKVDSAAALSSVAPLQARLSTNSVSESFSEEHKKVQRDLAEILRKYNEL